ncbi:peptidoglycan-binding protein [Nonomuraea lactucae]|uniref:peptidoglycan-binding protein n=1 Tax=Nonomuraea lactucae TaxID=2249762 RepID=UPI001962DD8E|nr:peptidoglycan-binding protein [Nonomuraea lactucae]
MAVLLAGGVCAALVAAGGGGNRGAAPKAGPKVASVAVTRTDLSDSREMEGTLGFGASRTIKGAAGGRVTWLPRVGATVKRGRQLYRVDDRPAVVFYGGTPMYRRLGTAGAVGRDVRVVADNLRALGYDIGAQPPPGTTVRPRAAARRTAPPGGSPSRTPAPGTRSRPVTVKGGDGVLTSSLIAAIKRWQPTAGMEPTGVLDVTDVVVTQGAVRVGKLDAQLGDEASAELLTLTATKKTVTVPVDVLDIGSIRKGQRVSVALPGRSTTPGRVTAISTIIQGTGDDRDGAAGNPSQQLDVTVSLKNAKAVRGVDAANVKVRFAAKTRKDVLVVPVGALLALSEGGYGVRVPGGRLVAVETGMFAKGLVEVSGEGIAEGTKVETAS